MATMTPMMIRVIIEPPPEFQGIWRAQGLPTSEFGVTNAQNQSILVFRHPPGRAQRGTGGPSGTREREPASGVPGSFAAPSRGAAGSPVTPAERRRMTAQYS